MSRLSRAVAALLGRDGPTQAAPPFMIRPNRPLSDAQAAALSEGFKGWAENPRNRPLIHGDGMDYLQLVDGRWCPLLPMEPEAAGEQLRQGSGVPPLAIKASTASLAAGMKRAEECLAAYADAESRGNGVPS